MATRTTAVGTQSSSDVLTAAEYNDAAGGWVRHHPVTSNITSITNLGDLAGLTTGAWTPPLRRYLFHFNLSVSDTNASEIFQVQLQEDGTQIQRWNFAMFSTSASEVA